MTSFHPPDKRSIQDIATDYFRYLGSHFPQQSASDEFYFLPRAEAALSRLDRLDDLDPDRIDDHVRYVAGLASELDRWDPAAEGGPGGTPADSGSPRNRDVSGNHCIPQSFHAAADVAAHRPTGSPRNGNDPSSSGRPSAGAWAAAEELELQIDRAMLSRSMNSVLFELGEAQTWRSDPTLYVKIPLLATERLLSRTDLPRDRTGSTLADLFAGIPRLLARGSANLDRTSELSREIGLDMVRDAVRFYDEDVRGVLAPLETRGVDLVRALDRVLQGFDDFRRHLEETKPRRLFFVGKDRLQKILTTALGYPKLLEEILADARRAHDATLRALSELARSIEPTQPWQTLLYQRAGEALSQGGLLPLFRDKTEWLRTFFRTRGIAAMPPGESVAVRPTPPFLESLRATASYRAPLTGSQSAWDPRSVRSSQCSRSGRGDHGSSNGQAGAHSWGGADDQGVFYITPGGADDPEELTLIVCHSTYLTAHETYPGHHLLDHWRLRHPNPIRRQIECPLFYEGWACYAERLVDDAGFVTDPRERLVRLKRELWRIQRTILDVEVHTGRMSLDQAAASLQALGFSAARARAQARRFAHTPGYQSCYFLGLSEIMRLRERFGSRLGLRAFHDTVLESGEIPFPWLEQKLALRVAESPVPGGDHGPPKIPDGRRERP